ncbi:hypothetical protein SAY86_005545 [Trapa natans]|uniref:Uncharacterized protein n=1 Tax=Trapa natans TaxID=22666 RepID=A0AAN7L9E7_TRANT|nr:hypothetical protein SAY86_005545 [Trapa natans]
MARELYNEQVHIELIEYAEFVFDEIVKSGVCPDAIDYKLMLIAYYHVGQVTTVPTFKKVFVETTFKRWNGEGAAKTSSDKCST